MTARRDPSSSSRRRQQQHHQRMSSGGSQKQLQQQLQQLRFVGCTASELRMSEVPALLAEHEQLARLCEMLLAERRGR